MSAFLQIWHVLKEDLKRRLQIYPLSWKPLFVIDPCDTLSYIFKFYKSIICSSNSCLIVECPAQRTPPKAKHKEKIDQ